MKNTILIRISLCLSFFFSLALQAQEQFAVYFDVDKDIADTASQKRLQQWMEDNKNVTVIKITGYADSTWTVDYNAKLSRARAEYVLQQLRTGEANITKDIEVKGFGETTVFSENKSNDRVVIIHYKTLAKSPTKLANAIKNARIGEKLRLENLNFHGDSGVPLPQSEGVLEDLLQIMKDNPTLQIEIQGHICCSAVTKGVDEMRIKTVYTYLVKNGIDEERLHYRAFGSTRPIYPLPEQNEEQRIANRRVEIEIMAK